MTGWDRQYRKTDTDFEAACPPYEFWWEQRPPGRPALVAKRRPGESRNPHTVVTRDVTEMRTILGIEAHDSSETAR